MIELYKVSERFKNRKRSYCDILNLELNMFWFVTVNICWVGGDFQAIWNERMAWRCEEHLATC